MRLYVTLLLAALLALGGVLLGLWWAPFVVGLALGAVTQRARIAVPAGAAIGVARVVHSAGGGPGAVRPWSDGTEPGRDHEPEPPGSLPDCPDASGRNAARPDRRVARQRDAAVGAFDEGLGARRGWTRSLMD